MPFLLGGLQGVLYLRVLLVMVVAAGCHAGPHFFLQHAHQPKQLRSLDLLGIEVVRFSNVQMTHDIFDRVLLEHLPIQWDIVVELLVRPLLKVIDYCHSWRFKF